MLCRVEENTQLDLFYHNRIYEEEDLLLKVFMYLFENQN